MRKKMTREEKCELAGTVLGNYMRTIRKITEDHLEAVHKLTMLVIDCQVNAETAKEMTELLRKDYLTKLDRVWKRKAISHIDDLYVEVPFKK